MRELRRRKILGRGRIVWMKFSMFGNYVELERIIRSREGLRRWGGERPRWKVVAPAKLSFNTRLTQSIRCCLGSLYYTFSNCERGEHSMSPLRNISFKIKYVRERRYILYVWVRKSTPRAFYSQKEEKKRKNFPTRPRSSLLFHAYALLYMYYIPEPKFYAQKYSRVSTC